VSFAAGQQGREKEEEVKKNAYASTTRHGCGESVFGREVALENEDVSLFEDVSPPRASGERCERLLNRFVCVCACVCTYVC